jgi:hypothetical protein
MGGVSCAKKDELKSVSSGYTSVNYDSCCYWYQTEPHLMLPALAPVDKRIPRVYAVEAQAAAKP